MSIRFQDWSICETICSETIPPPLSGHELDDYFASDGQVVYGDKFLSDDLSLSLQEPPFAAVDRAALRLIANGDLKEVRVVDAQIAAVGIAANAAGIARYLQRRYPDLSLVYDWSAFPEPWTNFFPGDEQFLTVRASN